MFLGGAVQKINVSPLFLPFSRELVVSSVPWLLLQEGSTHRNYLAAIYDARGPEHINLVGAASHVLLQLGRDEERFSSMALI